MQFPVRVVVGVLLGALVAIPLALFVHVLWWAAGFGALAAAIGFLGSFFLWTADRPATATDPGYEQVLFDRPNTVVSVVLMLVFAGSVVGYGALSPGGLPPETAAALAQMEADESRLADLAAQYQKAAAEHAEGARTGDLISSDLVVVRVEARKLLDELRAAERPAEFAVMNATLVKGAEALVAALDALNDCVMGKTEACIDARIAYADVSRAEGTLGEERAALGL